MTDYHHPALEQRLRSSGPKCILSLDGGGTRGIVALAFLEQIEAVLCGGDPADRLCNHFDLIGGTSTGSIIATALALGWRVGDIRQLYEEFAHSVFRHRWYRIAPIVNRYDAGTLETLLGAHFGKTASGEDLLLGSTDLRTGLAIATKRMDTGSPWIVSNIPWAPFYQDRAGPNGNWRIPLRNLVRASAAAPTMFRAVSLPLGSNPDGSTQTGRFVDGGATPYNNPVMRLFELARFDCFGLRWPTGKDELLIVSVGAGRFRTQYVPLPFRWNAIGAWLRALPQRLLLLQAIRVLQGMIGDGATHALRTLQSLGYCPSPVMIDSEVGDLANDLLGPAPLFTALRYDLDIEWLISRSTTATAEAQALRRMDAPELMNRLWQLAHEAALRDVQAVHLQAARSSRAGL